METHKIRVKVGAHEFEAEGSKDAVEAQFQAFLELVKAAPAPPSSQGSGSSGEDVTREEPEQKRLDRVYLYDENTGVVSLRISPPGNLTHGDIILLVLLGYELLADEREIKVIALRAALVKSRRNPSRLDRAIAPYRKAQKILKGGKSKGSWYELSNAGRIEAERILDSVLDQVA